jgi:tRNA G37 N-methylase Trm5
MEDDNIKNMEDDNIKNLKRIIREEGGHVSCVEPMEPVTVIFTKCSDPMYEIKNGEKILSPSPRYERATIEFGLYLFDNLDDIRPQIRDHLAELEKYNMAPPIFSIYRICEVHGEYRVRMGFVDHLYGKDNTELTYDEARELIKNPPDHVHYTYIQDLKTVYKL